MPSSPSPSSSSSPSMSLSVAVGLGGDPHAGRSFHRVPSPSIVVVVRARVVACERAAHDAGSRGGERVGGSKGERRRGVDETAVLTRVVDVRPRRWHPRGGERGASGPRPVGRVHAPLACGRRALRRVVVPVPISVSIPVRSLASAEAAGLAVLEARAANVGFTAAGGGCFIHQRVFLGGCAPHRRGPPSSQSSHRENKLDARVETAPSLPLPRRILTELSLLYTTTVCLRRCRLSSARFP